MTMTATYLIRNVRIVRKKSSDQTLVDLRLSQAGVSEIAPNLETILGEQVIDAAGRWIIPGLWDQHVHMGMWSETADRLNLTDSMSAREVVSAVKAHLSSPFFKSSGKGFLIGYGFRMSRWNDKATPFQLDKVSGEIPVVLVSGDGHSGWLNSAASNFLGLENQEQILEETHWFRVLPRIAEFETHAGNAYNRYVNAIAAAQAKGIVGIRDFDLTENYDFWPEFIETTETTLRIKASVYPDKLERVLTRGLKTGTKLAPLVEMGSLKIISDGSLGTMTAFCCEPYGANPEFPHGKQNYSPEQLRELLAISARHSLEASVHAIGDAAVSDALNAFQVTGARGSIEHAQLMRREDISRMAFLGIVASVQPEHLLDDREVTLTRWKDREDRCFMFGSMLNSGVRLALGSDAPVAPLDPWRAIDAAVSRSRGDEEAWNPEEKLTLGEALFCSVDFQKSLGINSRPDVVLLDQDPHQMPPLEITVALTMVNGVVVHSKL